MSHKHCIFCGVGIPVPRPINFSLVCKAETNTMASDTTGNKYHAVLVGGMEGQQYRGAVLPLCAGSGSEMTDPRELSAERLAKCLSRIPFGIVRLELKDHIAAITEQRDAARQDRNTYDSAHKREAANILKLMAEVERLRVEQRWIPVSERLPDEHVIVLVTCGTTVALSQRGSDGNDWFWCEPDDDGTMTDVFYDDAGWSIVSHWRPLPAPPAKEVPDAD